MWWKPESKDEHRIADILPRLESQFIEGYNSQFVLGVGSLFSTEGLRPLLLLNQLAIKVLSPVPYALRLQELPPNVNELLLGWDLPNDVVFVLVTPPEPVATPFSSAVRSGAAIRCAATHTRATLAVSLVRRGGRSSPAFLTVGHVAPLGRGSTIELVGRNWLGRTRFRSLGNVVECVTPSVGTGPAEYDAAIVELSSTMTVRTLSHQGAARIRSPLTQPVLATLHGAVSGVVGPAGIIGSLTAYGGPFGIWKNSWLRQRCGLVSQGDSGGILVLDSNQTLAGMIVGGSRVPNSTVYMAQYAHDMEVLERDYLLPKGFSLT